MNSYDCIVLGTGGIGSATLYHLAKRGLNVLGIDRHPPGHDRGSSHGDTRIIRLVYMEHPDYVPLLRRAYELWGALEEQSKARLFVESGLLQVGPADGVVIRGVRESAALHNLPVEELTPKDAMERFPGWKIDEAHVGMYEARAGYLHVERCVQAHAEAARQLGADLVSGEEVRTWESLGDGVRVTTDSATYSAARLVVTAGAWAGALLADLNLPLIVRRKPVFWYATDNDAYKVENGAPTFFFETDAGLFYGFPQIDRRGLKVAEHSGGETVVDPLAVDRELRPSDRGPVEGFLRRYMPAVSAQVTRHSVCMYTLTPDEHFLVGIHPEATHVAFVAGLSGHGFKFATVLGEVLADFTTTGTTTHPVDFLSPRRFA